MAVLTREQIATAFWSLISATAGFTKTSRRFIHWDQVAGNGQLPFLTMLKTGEQRVRQAEGLPILALSYHVFVYTSAGEDPDDVPDTAMNTLLDAIDNAVKPVGADLLNGNRQTLGGLVSHVYPLGPVFVDAGDVDGKGVAALRFEILTPWFT